jgi:hypothetical protein
MTAIDRVRRTQHFLKVIFGASAVLWSVSAAMGILVGFAAIGAMGNVSPIAAQSAPWIAIALGLAVFAFLAWRARSAWSVENVALWIEEHAPHLRYSLVTAVDPRFAASMDAIVEPLVAGARTGNIIWRRAIRSVLPAAIGLAVALTAYENIPESWMEGMKRAGVSSGESGSTAVIGSRLAPLSGRLIPPAYSSQRATQLKEPSTITGLQGSKVVLTGRGKPDGVSATVTVVGGKARMLPVRASGGGWQMTLTMSDTIPALLRLVDRHYSRLIITDPHADDPPTATLRLPVRDTTVKAVSGDLNLAADLSDEIGLERARFEYIISSGSGENFTFREGVLAEKSFSGAKRGQIAATIPFATFELGQGDRISVRAVTWDNNTLTGPGKGISETRTIRVARKGEYDSISINKAPSGVDTTLMSLRMLIIATEKLKGDRPKLERAAFVTQATKLGGQSEGIRRKIQQIIDGTTGGGQIATDRLLTTALNAMWEATRELYVASPEAALAPMYVAYKALESLRNAKRYYLRGMIRPIIVNLERVRLAGVTDSGAANPRLPRPAERSSLAQLRQTYGHAVRLLRSSPDSAVEALTILRVMSLRVSPDLASALGDVITAIHQGKDATPALMRARRWLEDSRIKLDSLPAWTGAW